MEELGAVCHEQPDLPLTRYVDMLSRLEYTRNYNKVVLTSAVRYRSDRHR